MKTLKLTFSILCLVTLMGCQTPPSEEIDFSIYFDKTGSVDQHKTAITTNDILEIFNLKENPFNYGKVRISTLSDTHLSKVSQVKLNPIASMGEYQQYIREAEIHNFVMETDSILIDLQNMKSGKPASSIFIPIHNELRRLSSSKATQKYLCVFSDLFENSSSLFSVYSEKEFADFLKNPAKLSEFILEKAPLPDDLSGIKIYIIHNPVLDTDSEFLAISQWFKNLLESKIGEVFIGANLVLE